MDKLVLVEWEDSAQPTPSWMFLDDAPDLEIIKCMSVGWIINENDNVLMIAPNIGDYESGGGAQGSAFIRIPKSAIIKTASLQEVK